MKKWELSNGYIIYQLLAGRSNSYLLKTPTANLLIDTSTASNCKKWIGHIQRLAPQGIDFLLLTHTHFDHCQNAAEIRKLFPMCKIVASKEAEQWVLQGTSPLPKGTNPITRIIVKIGSKFEGTIGKYSPFTIDIPIENDHSSLGSGFDIEIIETPGHSSDSVSILINREVALVGDTLFGIFPGSVLPPYANDLHELIRSWAKLLECGCSLFLPGHGTQISRELVQTNWEKRRTA